MDEENLNKIVKEIVENGQKINSENIINQIEPLIQFVGNKSINNNKHYLNRKKNIALVIPYHPLYETGGLEIGTRKLAEGLRRLGNYVEIITRGKYLDKDLTGKIMSPEGIDICGVGSGIEEIIPYLLNRKNDFDVVQWMEIFPPIPEKKHIYNNKAEQQYLASIILRALGIHTFLYVATSGNVTNRGTNNPNWPNFEKQRLNTYLHAGIEGFDMINSEISSEYSVNQISLNSEQKTVIPLGVDTNVFKPVNIDQKFKLRETLNLPKGKTIFICPGRFVRRKRQDFLFSIWQNMPEEFKNSSILLFVGGKAGDGQPDSIYKKLIQKINYYRNKGSNDIISIDLVPHDLMVKYIQASDAMIFPSEREGLGMVVLEAMACGKPIFASNISGVRDIIQNEEIGTLFEPNNPSQIRATLISFLNSRNVYIKKSMKARKFVIAKWSWKSISKKLNKFYEKF